MTVPRHQEDAPQGLLAQARALLIRTMTFYRDDPRTASWLRERLERLDQPLRIAVTGRVKAGKSTLINALVGEELAPTDAEERTQVNTVYRYGPEPKITVYTPHGSAQNIPVTSLDTGTIRDLQRWRPDEVTRLVIESPSPGLEAISLVETPGVSSSTVQDTGRSALAQTLSEADAVLYLTRHPHQTDIQFLQSMHELQVARCAPINTILVFSRADETGSGGGEALPSADRVARRYRDDPKVRAFSQYVLPCIGLLGQAAACLTTAEFQVLVHLARLPQADLEELLMSADRFANRPEPAAIPPQSRMHLLQRLGRFGLHRAISGIREGAHSVKQLSSALLQDSRLNELQEAVHAQFVERQDALRARSVLMAVDMVLRANPRQGVVQLRGEFERVLANTHEWDELRLLSALRSGQVRFSSSLQQEAERLLGAYGTSPAARLSDDENVLGAELADLAGYALSRWRQEAVNPLHNRVHREAVKTILRSCERLIAQQIRS
jgi:hypothetical protein